MLFLEFFIVAIIEIVATQEGKKSIQYQKSLNDCSQNDELNLASRLPELVHLL